MASDPRARGLPEGYTGPQPQPDPQKSQSWNGAGTKLSAGLWDTIVPTGVGLSSAVLASPCTTARQCLYTLGTTEETTALFLCYILILVSVNLEFEMIPTCHLNFYV